MEGCSFQKATVYLDGVQVQLAVKSQGIPEMAGGAGGEGTDQTASTGSPYLTHTEVRKQSHSAVDPDRLCV